MSTPGWLVWLKDNEVREDAVRYVAMDWREAAEEHARKRFDLDCGMVMELFVESPDGKRLLVDVDVVPVPTFHVAGAREVPS